MRTILLTIFLGCSIMDANATTVYDLAQDFSTVNNPSGVWSYGYKSINGSFTLYPTNYSGRWAIYEYYSDVLVPGFYQFSRAAFELLNNTGKPTLGVEWRPTLWPPLPSGPEQPTLRFTSPGSGNCTIQVSGFAEYGDVDFVISVNGEAISTQPVFQSLTVTNTTTVSTSSRSTIDFTPRITGMAVPTGTIFHLSGHIAFEAATTPALTFVPAGGLFTNSLNVHLINNFTNGLIRLTLDGTSPSAVSPAYTSPVTITNATEFRAAVFDGNTPISQVYTTSFARVYAIDDGIPASWREQYFGPGYLTDPRVAADADPDGDLATNREEYLAGTNPIDNTSGFKATVGAVPLIRFGSESNRVYRILRSDDVSTNRTVVATITATNSVTSYVDASVYPNKGFYVIELLP